jgi:hypothetical protein
MHIKASGHFEAQVPRHQRRRRFQEQVVQVVAGFLADLDGIAKALGGQQADLAAGALDDGVGDQRRAVHHRMQRDGGQSGLLQQPRDARGDRFGGIVGRGEALAGRDQVAGGVVQHEVGERAADIDADAGRRRAHGVAP